MININFEASTPIYKQLMDEISQLISSHQYARGEILPSMNELAEQLQLSKETVKKAYSLLRKDGIIDSVQGKGFFVTEGNKEKKINLILLFDKLSTYKQVLFDSFNETIGADAEITIRLHNQDIDLFEEFIDENLDLYDYYVITPHFALDTSTQSRLKKILKRIPNRKLVLLDKNVPDLPGNYGAVYQDFENDVCIGLQQVIKKIKKYKKLNVTTSSNSLYSSYINKGIESFCSKNKIEASFYHNITPDIIHPKEIYLILNSQLDTELIELVRYAKENKLKIGKDIGIISYNESPINEIILDGLTTVSTDFKQMGRVAANMILSQNLKKVRCDFKLIQRRSF